MENNEPNNIDFMQLTTREQIDALENAYNVIYKNIYENRGQDILSGKLEIIDIAYNETSDKNVVYDIKYMDNSTQEEKHEYYNKDLEKIDIDDKGNIVGIF